MHRQVSQFQFDALAIAWEADAITSAGLADAREAHAMTSALIQTKPSAPAKASTPFATGALLMTMKSTYPATIRANFPTEANTSALTSLTFALEIQTS
jgi:hypothetical protein